MESKINQRITNKVGDVYCVEIDGKYKSFIYYVGKDVSDLNSAIIKGFKKRYPMDYEPDLDEILSDETAFYTHTFIQIGVKTKAWYKIGFKKVSPNEKVLVSELTFGDVVNHRYENGKITWVNPLSNWRIWNPNQDSIWIGYLPENLHGIVIDGTVRSFENVVLLVRNGYVKNTSPIYDIIKRIPYPDVHSFTKRQVGDTNRYYHFKGESIIEEIIIFDNRKFRLNKDSKEAESFILEDFKFWEVNWARNQFTDKEEFDTLWND